MGSQLIYYGRRLATEALMFPKYKMRCGSRTVSIPACLRESSRLVRDWKPGCKTKIMQQYTSIKSGTFIDVGTNIGDTLLDFISVAGPDSQYVGFEANPVSARTISSLIATNQLDNALLVPVGLSNRTGLLELLTRTGHPSDAAATLLQGVRPNLEYDRQLVPCFRFSDIADDLKINTISLIKIDVEGAELLVLQGMRETLIQDRPPVICEVLHRDKGADPKAYSAHLSGLQALLLEVRYSVFRIERMNNDIDTSVSYSRCSAFPDLIYGNESANLCDYLFLPSEHQLPSGPA